MTENYSQINFLRIIKRIPIIIKNFQCGVPVRVLASQNECSEAIIEEIIRIGFNATFKKIKTIDTEQE